MKRCAAFTLVELICAVALIVILASLVLPTVCSKVSQLRWRVFFVQSFHNGRLAQAIDAERRDWNPDIMLEDGSYLRALRQ